MPVPDKPRVLYVSSRSEKRCGVYQFGKSIADTLVHSQRYEFIPVECDNAPSLFERVRERQPAAVIYNYHPETLGWVKTSITRRIPVPQIGTIHECPQDKVDRATNELFDFHIAPDPTLLLKNPYVFTTGRCIPTYQNNFPEPAIPTIGSFGFGLEGKGFDRLIAAVQDEFDEACLRLHIPFSPILDPDGSKAKEVRDRCHALIQKRGIELQLSHDFLGASELLDFLAQNTLNAFLYDPYPNRGLSSSIDYALAVMRPIAVSRSDMFRHLRSATPPIDLDQASLRQIIAHGLEPLTRFHREWSAENLIWDYERIVSRVLERQPKRPWYRHPILRRARSIYRRLRDRTEANPPIIGPAALWLQPGAENPNAGIVAFAPVEKYRGEVTRNGTSLNRILDNSAREQYRSAIDELSRLVPEIVKRKIPEANIQQAFVLDTVHSIASRLATKPKMLCVGSYEDSAAASLKRIGYSIEEIDPLLNYDLAEFMTRPSTRRGSYDIVFSTSVIEHVEDDEAFLVDIASLLAPGGTTVLTCDYLDQYRPGDPRPGSDFRFYTQRDFRERLLPLLKDCALVDEPQWDCPAPDFSHAGFQYTFATLVFEKDKTPT